MMWAKRAVLLVDVVESVRLVEQDEADVIARWLALVEHVKSKLLPNHNGRMVKSLGDGMLLDFEDVRSAIGAAFAIQDASKRANTGVPPERQILLRMGVEVGDVIVDTDDVHGRGVNLAARLMSLAGPGEIVISAHARDELTPNLDADMEDLGDCFVRHVNEPVRAYRAGPPGPRPVVAPAVLPDDLAPTIAVVPFSARRAPEDHQVLGEVIADEIIQTLSRASDMNVISRLSTTALRGRQATLAEIGTLLNADYVLSGTYSTVGEKVRLDAELAEVKSGKIVWTDRLDDRIPGVLAGESETIGRVVSKAGASIVRRELVKSQSQPLPTLKAYTLLLSAITLLHRLSLRDFDEALRLFQALIDRGVHHPLPQAWLAYWYVMRVQQGWSPDPKQDASLALECTKRALDLDPDCSLALAVDGLVHTHFLRRMDIANERYNMAIQTNPNNSLAWLLRGTQYAFMDEGMQAVSDTQRALALSPLDPHRYYYDSLAASAHLAAAQYEHALDLALQSLRANRKHTSTLRVLLVAQWQLGRHEEARQTARELMKLEPKLTVSGWLSRSPGGETATGRNIARVLKLAGIPD